MKISNLITNEVNQNDYHFNKLTRNKIGFLYIAPVNIVPDDCLACDGYVLKIIDYKKLYSVIGDFFNKGEEAEDEFRIPDYNITGRFLQPSKNVGISINAGLPNITGALVNPPSSGWSDISDLSAECFSGAFYGANRSLRISVNADQWGNAIDAFRFDASRSNGIYGGSNTVQPPSQTVHVCIKYK